MDVFQGNYKDGTNKTKDLRFFSGIFFSARFINVAGFLLMNSSYFWMLSAATITMLGFSIAVFRPQKTFIHYLLDLVAIMILSFVMFFAIGFTLQHPNTVSKKIDFTFRILVLILPILYIILLLCYWVLVKRNVCQTLARCLGWKCGRYSLRNIF